MYLLDTDVLIDIQRDYEPAVAWFESLDELPGVPGYVAMELIQKADNARQVEQAMRLVAPFEIVWPSELDCDLALQHFRACHLSHGLGLLDALIGACALSSDKTLCTFNAKHFRMIPGLELEKPYDK